MRVLGIDTALRASGVGVVARDGSRFTALDCGVIRTPASRPMSECLVNLRAGLLEVIARSSPTAVAIEGAFFHRNPRTAFTLGQARGVAILTCAEQNLPVFEYAPRRVKQAVVGFGAAGKEQVQHMVQRLLNLPTLPPPDAADALALALCHLQSSRTGHPLLSPAAM